MTYVSRGGGRKLKRKALTIAGIVSAITGVVRAVVAVVQFVKDWN